MIGPDTGYGYVFTSVWLPKAGIEVIHTKILEKKAKIQISKQKLKAQITWILD